MERIIRSRKSIIVFAFALVLLVGISISASAVNYYSQNSLAVNTLANWNSDRGGSGSAPLNFTTSGDVFYIQNGHSMTTSANWTVTGNTINIESGGNLTTSSNFTITAATIKVDGTYTNGSTGAITGTMTVNGTYNHAMTTGTTTTIPTASWASNSNCNITASFGANSVQIAGFIGQTFGNFTYNPTTSTSTVDLCPATGSVTINGNFTIQQTGGTGGVLHFRLSGVVFSPIINVNGTFYMQGGTLDINNNGGTSGTSVIVNLFGDFNQSGGTIKCTTTTASVSAFINFAKTGTQTFTKTGGTMTGNSTTNLLVTVNSGSTLQIASGSVLGTAGDFVDFTLSSGATLGITSAAGITTAGNAAGSIQAGGTRSYSATANYLYNGSVAQATGNGLTAASSVTISNSSGVTLSNSVAISGNLSIGSGSTLNLNSITTSSALSLTLGGTPSDPSTGTWGGSTSGAANTSSYFTSNAGTISINCATGTWIGGSSVSWETPANWACSTLPDATTNVIINSGGNQPTISSSALCNNILINTGATLTISGTNTLTVSGSWTGTGNFVPNSGTVIFNAAGAQTVGSEAFYNLTLAGSGLKTLSGVTVNNILSMEGTATVSGVPTYGTNATLQYKGSAAQTTGTEFSTPFAGTGGVIINNSNGVSLNAAKVINYMLTMTNGTLNMANTNLSVGSLTGSGNLTHSSGTAGNRTLTIGPDNTSPAAYTGVISNGTATSVIVTKSGTGTLILSGANTYTGATNITAGVLKLGASSAVNTSGPLGTNGGGTTVTSGAALDMGGFSLTSGATESLSLAGTGVASKGALTNSSATASTYIGIITIASGGASIVGDVGNLLITGTPVSSANAITLGGSAGGSFTTVIAGNRTITKEGTGTWLLSGTNTYTGITTISNGILKIGNTSALGTIAGGTVVSTGGTLDLNGITLGTAEPLTINGTGASAAGAVTNSSATAVTYSGLLTLGSASTILVNNGTINFSAAGTITGATFGLTLDGIQTTASAIAGIIGTTTGTVTKNGAGAWTLSGANTFTGGTTLNSGTLNINNASALGNVAGTFTITGGTIDNTSGAIISTSNYPLALNGDFTYSGSVPRTLNLGAGNVTMNSNRQITVSAGTLTIGGILNDNTHSITKAGAGTMAFGSNAVTLKSLTVSAGILTSTSGTLSLAGDFTNNGTFNSSGTVTFNGTVAQAIGGSSSSSFTNLTISNSSAAVSVNTNENVSGTFSVGTGALVTPTATTVFNNGAAAGTITGSGTIQVTRTASTADYSNQYKFSTNTLSSMTVDYAGAGAQTVNALATPPSVSYGNLKLSGSGIKSFDGAIKVSGNVTIASGVVASLGALLENQSYASTLTLNTTGYSTGTYGPTGSSASNPIPTYFGSSGLAILNITTSSCVAGQWTGGTSTDWNVSANWCSTGGGGVPGNATNVTIPALSLNQPVISAANALCNDITIESGASLSISNSTYGLTVSGNWTNNGTYNANNIGTITFDKTGGTQTVASGGSSFYNLTHSGSGTLRITDALTTINSLNNSGGQVDMNGQSMTVGDLTGSGNITTAASGEVTLTVGSDNATTTYSGNILNGSGTISVTKTGTGILTLSGTNTYTGVTTINSGKISVATIGNGGVNGNIGAATNAASNLVLGGGTLMYTGLSDASTDRAFTLTSGTSSTIEVSTNNLTISGASASTTGSLTKTGNGTLTLSGANFHSGGTTLSAGTLNINNASALGTAEGIFTISGGTIDNTSAGPITTNNYPLALNSDFTFTGTKNLNLGTGSVTLGASPQITTTGGILTIGGTINDNTKNLTKAGSGTLSFEANDVTINALTISAGTFVSTSGTLNLAGNFSNSGTFTQSSGTVNFNGSSAQLIGGSAIATFINLTISNTSGVTTSKDITVNGILHLAVNNPSATTGSLELVSDWGTYPSTNNAVPTSITSSTLYMGASATTAGIGDVSGIVTRNTIVANTSYTFGNQYTNVSLTAGTMPTSMTVVIKIGVTPAGKPDAVKRSYQILPTGGSGCNVSANFHYLASELTSSVSPYFVNTESKMVTWDYDLDGGYSTPDEHGRAAYDFTNKYIGLSNVPISYFIYDSGTHAWRTIFTLGDRASEKYLTWTGLTSTSWTDGSNWSPYGNVPDATCFVIIPDVSTTYNRSPVVPATQSVNTMTIESGGVLNLGSSTLTIANSLSAGWEDRNPSGNDPGTSTVVFSNAGASVSGTARFYNLSIGSGASLTNALGSTVKIAHDVSMSGTWITDLEEGAVEYNGSGDQLIVLPTMAKYDSLIVSGSGIKTLPSSSLLTIDDDLTILASANLTLGGTDKLNVNGNIVFSGGTLTVPAGVSETVNTLKLDDNSTLSLGTGTPSLSFAASSAVSWTAGKTLTVTGWAGPWNGGAGTAGRIYVGTDASGLTVDQLAQMRFYSGSSYFPATIIEGTGEVVPIASEVSWTGGTADWGTADNWDPHVVPGSGSVVTITDVGKPPVISSISALCENLTITSGVLTISSTGALTVNGTLTNSVGIAGLVIQSDASGNGQLIYNGSAASGTVKMFLAGGGAPTSPKIHYFVPPVTSMTIQSGNYIYSETGKGGGDATTVAASLGISPTTDFVGDLLKYNEAVAPSNQDLGWEYYNGYTASNLYHADPFTLLYGTKGYMIYLKSDNTITFTGTLNSVNQDLPITRSGGKGWNLVGNPFPCNIDLLQLTTLSSVVDKSFYFYHSGIYDVYNLNTGGTGGYTQYVPPMQGFFVHDNTSGSNNFPVIVGAKTLATATPRSKAASSVETGTLEKLKLVLNSSAGSDETVVCLIDIATTGFDPDFDAYKLIGSNTIVSLIYTTLNSEKYAINALPGPVSSPVVIPVTVILRSQGDYRIDVPEFENLDGINVILRHGTSETLLTRNSSYSFTSAAGTFSNFELIIGGSLTGFEKPNTGNSEFRTWYNKNMMYINCPSDITPGKSILTIIDTQGRAVYQKADLYLTPGQTIQQPVNLQKGVYISQVLINNQRFVSKLIVF